MSEQNQSSQEKSHEASPTKLERARKKGDLPRSQDVQTAAAYLGFSMVVLLMGGWIAVSVGEVLMNFLSRPAELASLFTSGASSAVALQGVGLVGGAIAALFVVPAVLILVLLITQKSIVMAPEKLIPKMSRINPVSNAKQKYGPHGLFEFLKSMIKLIAISTILGIRNSFEIDRLPSYARIQPQFMPLLLWEQFWNIMIGVLIFAFAVALIDYMWQRHSHLKKMRMTLQEVKDESKQAEGDPYMRASRRERGREIANNRMLHDVASADVVITNPTHYAVALKWSRDDNAVPVCLAKGEDELARRIRVRAQQEGIPLHPDPPTARSIHALVEVGQPIRPDHYKAVAAAIVFADKLRAQQRERDNLLN